MPSLEGFLCLAVIEHTENEFMQETVAPKRPLPVSGHKAVAVTTQAPGYPSHPERPTRHTLPYSLLLLK